jgi:MFS family permease
MTGDFRAQCEQPRGAKTGISSTAALASELFGAETGSVVYGWIFASHQVGAAFAAFAAGAIRTWMGDYVLAFMSAGILCLLAAALVIRLPSSRHEPVSIIVPRSTEASIV